MIAPIVFAAYSRPNDWLRCAFELRWRVSVGSVAPMRIVAGASARSARPRRMSARSCGASSSATAISPYSDADDAERERRRDDDDHEDELDDAVQPERRTHAIGEPPAERAADRHAAEEPGEDRRDGLCRVAEDEDQLARPDDLVDEAGGPGQDEDRQDRPA